MYQTLTVSDVLFQKLQTTARDDGFESLEDFIQKLIEVWQAQTDELRHRQTQVLHVNEIRERLLESYGEMQDSVELVRADRDR